MLQPPYEVQTDSLTAGSTRPQLPIIDPDVRETDELAVEKKIALVLASLLPHHD